MHGALEILRFLIDSLRMFDRDRTMNQSVD